MNNTYIVEQKRIKVLIVDNDWTIRFILGRILEKNFKNVDITYSASSDNAIVYLTKQKFNLAIVDLICGGKYNGFDLIQWIKKNRQEVKTIMLTVDAFKSTAERAYSLGCDLFLSKPVDTELVEGVQILFNFKNKIEK